MSFVHSYIEQLTHSLKSGLSLYWDDVTSTCCALATAFWAQCGSSLYEPALPDFTSPPSR